MVLMKLLQGKWIAGVLSLAFVASCVGGCAQPTGNQTSGSTTGAAASSESASTEATAGEGDAGVDVPAPEGAAGDEAKPE